MKKIFSAIIALFLIVSSVSFVSAANDEISVYLDGYSGANGQKITFDVPPQTVNNRTMVPIRAIFEAMGATVEWDEATRTAISTKGDTTVKMTLNSTTEYINDTAYEMDVTPVIIGGRTLAPARYVAEAFGYTVNWDAMTKTVLIGQNAEYDMTKIKDGTRKHPYKFGDTVTVNVLKLMGTEPKSTFTITLKKLVSPAEMEETMNHANYYTYDEDTWYLNCDVTLNYYENDSAYSFPDFLLAKGLFVTSNGTTLDSSYTWYQDPSKHASFKLFEGDSGECYIPIKMGELADGETVDYFSITTYTGNQENYSEQKTVWFSLK